MSFKKTHYKIVRNVISKDLAKFIYHYFLIKRQVARTLFDTKYISPFTTYWGVWNETQVPDTYSHYSDIVFETLMGEILERVEKETGHKLFPTYSYGRIYKTGDVLARHTDRNSCEISATMHLGGDAKWPIYLSKQKNAAGLEVNLEPGDILIYKGCELEHWREGFPGKDYCQAFLHYIDKSKSDIVAKHKFDGRPFLGLPSWFVGKNLKK